MRRTLSRQNTTPAGYFVPCKTGTSANRAKRNPLGAVWLAFGALVVPFAQDHPATFPRTVHARCVSERFPIPMTAETDPAACPVLNYRQAGAIGAATQVQDTAEKPGAGEANRTPDPNLGKVMLYP